MAYFEKLDTDKDSPCRGCDLSCPDHWCKAYQNWLNNDSPKRKKYTKEESEKIDRDFKEAKRKYKERNK